MKKLYGTLDRIFSSDGAITKLGGRHTDEQHRYAICVLDVLLGKGNNDFSLGCLEAETGIGKSLGYIIPSLLVLNENIKNNGSTQPIAISTFTRLLQKQILVSDYEFACKVLDSIGIENKVACAYRMGRKAFFSSGRVKLLCENLIYDDPARTSELNDFYQCVHQSCTVGSGLILDFLEEYSVFPNGITVNDVCLIADQDVDNDAYTQHLTNAKNADLLITNHLSLITTHSLSNNQFLAIICDEAHEIAGACDDLFNFKKPLSLIKNNFLKVLNITRKGGKDIERAIKLIDELDENIRKEDRKNTKKLSFWTVFDNANFLKENQDKVREIYNHVQSSASKYKELRKGGVTLDKAVIFEDFDYINLTLKNWIDVGDYKEPAIGFSEKNRNPSLTNINVYSSRIFALKIKRMTDKLILTSATISDTKKQIGSEFKALCANLGFPESEIVSSCKLSPRNYGQMNFVLTEPSIIPLKKFEGELVFNKQWINHVGLMINEARKSGKSILVLCVSFDEAREVYRALSNKDGVVYHKRNTGISEYLPSFVSGDNQVFITPCGWEGLSLRDKKGEQLIGELIISRLPYSPPNELYEYVLSKKGSGQSTKNFGFYRAAQECAVKLKQGLGRGIRSPTDNVRVWFADGRMPNFFAKEAQNKVLINVIQSRFLDNYANAQVFGVEKKEIFVL